MEFGIAFAFALATLAVLTTLLLTLVALLPTSYDPTNTRREGRDDSKRSSLKHGKVQVVVLGDIGRSPRMQYHAASLAALGLQVEIIGYRDSDLNPELVSSHLVSVVPLAPPPALLQRLRLPFALSGPLKAILQTLNLFDVLAYKTSPAKWVLVQNPPAIPTLLVAQLVCVLRGSRLIIDWHNYGWSILALKLDQSHPLVRISRYYEFIVCRAAHAHFTVTEAMSRDLRHEAHVHPLVLHDRPAAHFQPIVRERHEVLAKLDPTKDFADEIIKGNVSLLVSSTSWTPDEDFSVLLDALVAYSSGSPSLPRLLVVITGKGPQKDYYTQKIAELHLQDKLKKVVIKTAWLSIQDYASLLAVADLGVCLHQSSSGLDLPMKVVDMFGAGLPVLAWSKYEAFAELIQEGVNGYGFTSAEELKARLEQLVSAGSRDLEQLRQGALKESQRRWKDEWLPIAGKLFQDA